MMYSNKLAVAVKVNGKFLRDTNETAFIPFGSEYSLLIKNLNTVRVEVRVQIDGTDATDGCSLVIGANKEIELKRFIKGGNLNEGNAFKFIERTAGIERHRGVGLEDGLIRVEYQYEKVLPVTTIYQPGQWIEKRSWEYRQPEIKYFSSNSVTADATYISNAVNTSSLRSGGIGAMSAASGATASIQGSGFLPPAPSLSNIVSNANYTPLAAVPMNDAGITVPGQVVDQKFNTVAWFPVEDTKHVMVIKLLGETETGQQVQQPITVKAKPKCVTCGTVNKANAKFCSQCGTSLTIV